jgi:hypothetical protein
MIGGFPDGAVAHRQVSGQNISTAMYGYVTWNEPQIGGIYAQNGCAGLSEANRECIQDGFGQSLPYRV